jgi:putative membrane protein
MGLGRVKTLNLDLGGTVCEVSRHWRGLFEHFSAYAAMSSLMPPSCLTGSTTGFTAWILIPVFAAFVMVMWDLCMDPINSTVRRAWVWRDGGAYFDVPFVNFLGWYLCIYSVYQAFALYLRSMDARERPPHLGEHATWSIPAYMYGAVMLNSFVPAVLGDNVQVTSRDGHVWWTGDIHSARALIAIFTMLFFTLLALVRVHRSLGASRLDGGDTD